MNKRQHFFIWAGIALITFMAILLASTLFWLIAALTLIGESIWLCKDESLSDNKRFLLFIAIVIFAILFINSKDIRREMGIHQMGIHHHYTPSKIIRR